MRWIAEPNVPNLAPREFYRRTNTLTSWLDWCAELHAQLSAPSWRAWVAARHGLRVL